MSSVESENIAPFDWDTLYVNLCCPGILKMFLCGKKNQIYVFILSESVLGFYFLKGGL